MELQQNADIFDFTAGPFNDDDEDSETMDSVKKFSNQVMDFLMGFSPNIAPPPV